jgi:uncharacterized protein
MRLRAVALPLLLIYPFYAAVMYAEQMKVLFPAYSEDRHALRAGLPADARLVAIPASFGDVRAVYRVPASMDAPAGAALYIHGNFERVEDSMTLMQPLVDAGMPVLQVEFPGFGGADGRPDFSSINDAAVRAYDWLARRPEVDARRIVVIGYSIGGGVAAELTRRRPLCALVLLSSYTSLAEMAHRYLLPAFLLRYPFDNLARVRGFDGPVLIEHGRRDRVIPFAMGRRLAEAGTDVEFVPLDCGHDDCDFKESIFRQRLPAWLAAHGLLNALVPAAAPARAAGTAWPGY